MRLLLIVLIALAIAIAGCIGQAPIVVSDLTITAGFDPPEIKPVETATFFIDMENKGAAPIRNLTVDVFDTGILSVIAPKPNSCLATLAEFRSAQLESIECQLAVTNPSALIQPTTPVTVRFRTTFEKSIASTFVVDMLTLEEYRRLERLGRLETKPQSMTFGDSQVQATLQFAKAPPFLAGDTVVAYLNIRNAGPGNIYTLEPARFSMSQAGSALVCNFDSTLYSTNGVFVPITCIFTAPMEIETAATYSFTLGLSYDYEIRQSASLTVSRE